MYYKKVRKTKSEIKIKNSKRKGKTINNLLDKIIINNNNCR